MTNILVTGGAGYIASHTNIELAAAGFTPIIVDNFANSSKKAIERTSEIIGKPLKYYEGDIRDSTLLDKIFTDQAIEGVIHFAGLKSVGESTKKPLLYYKNNIDSTLVLLEAMDKNGVKKLVFSSSATIYGSAPIPYSETGPVGVGITNPYGRTKYMIECILCDEAAADDTKQFTILRYFNPLGAHSSGKIGEDPNGIPNNLMPYIAQVAVGKRDALHIFGNDYDTVDGTGVRDYIHVVDLAAGHVKALQNSKAGCSAYNLGSGKGMSVFELVHAFERASGKKIPYVIDPRRDGDLPIYYAATDKAKQALQWEVKLTIDDMCKDTWNWQSQNPNGYKEE